MTSIVFGRPARGKKGSVLSVTTPQGDLEPSEPSKVAVYANAAFTPLASLVRSLLGILVSVTSYPYLAYVHTSAEGLMVNPATEFVPFDLPGLALNVKRGAKLADAVVSELEGRGFVSMQIAGGFLFVKKDAAVSDYEYAETISEIEDVGVVPAHYLHRKGFGNYLTFRSLTTRICEYFHASLSSLPNYKPATQRTNSKLIKPWVAVLDDEAFDEDDPMAVPAVTFQQPKVYKLTGSPDNRQNDFVRLRASAEGIASENSGVVVNPLKTARAGFFTSGRTVSLDTHGLLFKFNQELALPDQTLAGDVIGKRFLKALGDDFPSQVENLAMLKSTLGLLRLTRLGDEIAHFYKCVDIAIDCNAACIPIFSSSEVYEGALVAGGPGASISIYNQVHSFQDSASLKSALLVFSDHSLALNAIVEVLREGQEVTAKIRAARSMRELREILVDLQVSSDERDTILRRAASLDYGESSWGITPANLKRCFEIISNTSDLNSVNAPIGRLTLFSKDMVTVALSCFGEKSCPSWNLPAGSKCSLKRGSPPSLPPGLGKKGGKGTINDAGWVMVVNSVHLSTSAEEFRRMASTWEYRSTSSSLARKAGHKVFSRDQMGEFWGPMREALRVVDPVSYVEQTGEVSKKRDRDSGESTAAAVPEAKRARTMGLKPLVRSNAVRKMRAQTPAQDLAGGSARGKEPVRAMSPRVQDSGTVTGSIIGSIEEGEILE